MLLCLKSPRLILDRVSTGSGSDLVCDQHAIFLMILDSYGWTRSLPLPVLTRSKYDSDFCGKACLCLNHSTFGNDPGKFCFAEDRLVIFNLSVIEFDNAVSDGVIPVVMTDHEHGLTSRFQLRQEL